MADLTLRPNDTVPPDSKVGYRGAEIVLPKGAEVVAEKSPEPVRGPVARKLPAGTVLVIDGKPAELAKSTIAEATDEEWQKVDRAQ